jgi:hypothetical protein
MQRDAFTKFVVEHTYWAACADLLRGCRPEAVVADDTPAATDRSAPSPAPVDIPLGLTSES